MIGQTIDRYHVIEKIGEGGMGAVYRARDTLLHRHVALKMLPPDHLGDPGRRDRFIQEAKSASALNHPGIVAIHDVLNVDGQDIIVMELVEGETLHQIMTHRRPRLDTALHYAIGVADAVSRAHAAGIVHRDLKPSNVMVTRDDQVKILDFGLAKHVGLELRSEEAPTVTAGKPPLTETRAILGTLPYMSPEQASGEPIDARSDVFSFGVMVYEMLTGRHPFRRSSSIETLQAIVDSHPDPPSRIVPALPPELERAILRCLRRNPGNRWQSLSDLKAVLEDIKEDSETGRTVVIRHAGRPSRTKVLPVAAALLLAIVAAAYLLFRGDQPDMPPLQLNRVTYDGGLSGMPALSSDGKLLAYASDRAGENQLDIWVRHINRPGPARLTHHPADDSMPSFSPDGSRIAFHSWRSGGGIYLINTLGGEPRRIASGGLFPRFSPDGSWIVFLEAPDWSPGHLRRMFLVSPEEGEPRPFLPEYGATDAPMSTGAIWSPDGTRLMFRGAPFEDPADLDWRVAPVDGSAITSTGVKEAIPRIDVVQFPCAWLPGQLLFVAGTTIEGINLYSAPISPEGRITGPHRPLTAGPGITWMPAVAWDGRTAMSRLEWLVHLWQVEMDPGSGQARGEPRQIVTTPVPKLSISLTRDGSRLAYSSFSGPAGQRRTEVRIRDLAGGTEEVALSRPARTISLLPHLSPDGSSLSWTSSLDGGRVVHIATTDDPTESRELCAECAVAGFTSDGKSALVRRGRERLELIPLAGGKPRELLRLEPSNLIDVDLSWDDRWLALAMGRQDGRVEIVVLPAEDPPLALEDGIVITDGMSWTAAPRWSPDGRFLYYLSDRDDFVCIWGTRLDEVTKQRVGNPFPVAHAHGSSMSMRLPRRDLFTMTLGRGRIIFNAGASSSEIYTAMLEDIEEW